jgi:hypothetical protein
MSGVAEEVGGTDVLPPASTKPKAIAILGSHPATVAMAPFADPTWLIYACSPHNFERRRLPRFDAWFEVHIPVAHQTRALPYLEYVKTLPKVWMRDKDAIQFFPGGQLYPEAEMKAEFGPYTFTSSIAFMLAMAIKDCERMGMDTIGLFGIMQASPNEYTQQRPGIQNLIWHAAQRKIHVIAPDISKLFEPPPEDF